MEIIGLVLFFLIGVTLALIGTGGAILAVPVLVYLFNIEKVEATVYSLFIISCTSFTGSVQHIFKKIIRWDLLLWFCIPSVVAIFISRRILLPALPDDLFVLFGMLVTKGNLLMLLFAVLMILSAYNMLKPKIENGNQAIQFKPLQTILIGFGVGLLVGFVGAGGGFIIVPALIFFMGLEMRQAVGNSLVIIFINSTIGFLVDTHAKSTLQWKLILPFAVASILGIIIGFFLSMKIQNTHLKKYFGWFVLAVGTFVIYAELIGFKN